MSQVKIGDQVIPVATREFTWTLRRQFATSYLSVLALIAPATMLFNGVFPGGVVLKGQSLGIVVPFLIFGAALVAWFAYTPATGSGRIIKFQLITLTAVWVGVFVLDWRDSQGINYTAFLVPLALLVIAVKPPTARMVDHALWSLAIGVVAVAIAWMGKNYVMNFGEAGPLSGVSLRIPGVTTTLGEGGRWSGPFGSPNYAGPAAALLLLFVLYQRTRWRWGIITPSALMLVLSGSRSAYFGLALGVAVWFVYRRRPLPRLQTRMLRATVACGALAAAGMLALSRDPTLNGRTPIWPGYLGLWQESFLTGVGTASIEARIRLGELNPWFVHAHNMVLDPLGRYGIVMALLVVTLLLLTVVGAWRVATTCSLSLSLTSAYCAIGLVEVHGSWLYWSIPTSILVLSALLADQLRPLHFDPRNPCIVA